MQGGMSLFEMSQTAKQLYELLEAGEIDEQILTDTLESIGASEKLESYVHVQRQIESEIAAFDAEIKRMQDKKKMLENRVERLKQATKDFMLVTNQKKASAGLFTLSLRENKSCEILDASKIPVEYLRQIPATTEPDKKSMLAALKEGKQIEGASLKTSYSVSIK